MNKPTQVQVYSRRRCLAHNPLPNEVLISIQTPQRRYKIDRPQQFKAVLNLDFEDTNNVKHKLSFSRKQAQRTYQFIRAALHGKKDFVIHCDAGISRSVAIGLFLADVFDADVTYHRTKTATHANWHVYNSLVRIHSNYLKRNK